MSRTPEVLGGPEPDAAGARGLDAAEFARLYEEHRDALRRFCARRTRDRQALDDLVQDIFERAFARRALFQPDREFWPWLASIASRTCIDAHRRAVSAEARHDRYGRDSYREPSDLTFNEVFRREEHRRLEGHLRALPPRQRAALGLIAVDGWSYEQVARHSDYSVPAVKALVYRARASLRESLGRWAGVLVGAGQSGWRRFQRTAWRAEAACWPIFEALGSFALGPTALRTLLLVPAVIGAGAGRSAPAVGLFPASVAAEADGTRPDGSPGGSALSTAPTPGDAVDYERPVTADSERAAFELTAELVPSTTETSDNPENVWAESFAVSPDYERDPTMFLAGQLTWRWGQSPSVPLLVSRDGGASWKRARGLGLAPVTKLLLPPAYPRDPRIFAATAKGLLVSDDGGDSFQTVVPLAGITDASLSPAFNAGDPTVALVAGARLWELDVHAGLAQLVTMNVTAAAPVVLSVAHDPASPDGRTVIVGSRFHEPVRGDPMLHVSRCSRRGDGHAGVDCTSVKLPFTGSAELPLRLSAAFRPGLVFVPNLTAPLVSTDGGRSFRAARAPSGAEDVWVVRDLSPVPSAGGRSAIVAQSNVGPPLARTDDGGLTWTGIRIDVPGFDKVTRVVVTPTGRFIAGAWGGGGIACSEDGGRSWARTCPTPEPASR